MSSDPPTANPSKSDLARELLLFKMREYSQDGFCASWLIDLEFEIWDLAESPPPNDPAMGRKWLWEQACECRRLGEIADGWWIWGETTDEESHPETFISMEEWMARLAAKRPAPDSSKE